MTFPSDNNNSKRMTRSLAFTLSLALALPVHAQEAAAPAASAPENSGGFGMALKPTVKRGSPKAGAPTAPYTPVQASGNDGQVAEIDMFVGESRVFPAPGVARIAVGNGRLLSAAALDEKEVILFANGEGTSSLFIWNADGRYQRVKINIVAGDTSRHAREIAAFLSTIPNARTSIIGANIVVEGEQLSDFDLEKIEALSKRYPQIVNFTNRVGWERMVAMDVKVVEFPTSVLKEVGLKWNSTGGGALAAVWGPITRGHASGLQINQQSSEQNPPPVTGPNKGPFEIPSGLNVLSVLNLGLNAQLNLLAQDGKATLLAEPQLSARNGAKASFLAGGELPYAVSNRDGTTILFKPYGIKVDITPRVDASGVIRATIESEVSSIDRSVTTTFGPALLTRKTNTEFNLRDGETLVLSGLLQRDSSTDIDKIPLLGDIPILGALFRSKRFQNKETELVVFVTPRVVAADSPSNRDRIQQTTERLQARMGPTPYLTDPVQPGVSYEKADKVPQRPGQPPADNAPVPPPVTAEAPLVAGIGRAPEGALLRVQAPQAVLRAQPIGTAEALLTLQRGATVVLGSAPSQPPGQGRWTNVHVGAINGWVLSEQIVAWRPSDAGQPDVRPAVVQTVPGLKPALLGKTDDELLGAPMRVQSEALALRITPDVNATVVWRAQRGDVVRRLNLPPQGAWLPVQIGAGPTGKRGWVLAQWLVPLNMP
ncbi:MAG TPA: pilus assembly protein N-terminal domain-containing protein [Roseateles sp.]